MGISPAARIGRSALGLCLGFAWGCATQNPVAQLDNGERAYREGRTSEAEMIFIESLAEDEA